MFQNFIIRKTKNPEPLARQDFAPPPIIFLTPFVTVLAAISFDTQTRRDAAEVDDVSGNGNLSAEVKSIEFTVPKQRP